MSLAPENRSPLSSNSDTARPPRLQLGPPLDLASLGLVAKELPWPRAVRLLQLLPLAALQPNVVLQGAVIAQCERAGPLGLKGWVAVEVLE